MQYLYEGCCSSAGHVRTCRLADYEADPTYKCPECDRQLKQVITAPRYLNRTSEFQSFKSPVDGSIVTSETSLREHNARNGVVNIHEGYDDKAVKDFVNKDFQKPLDRERSKDLRRDAEIALNRVSDGYKPQVAQEE